MMCHIIYRNTKHTCNVLSMTREKYLDGYRVLRTLRLSLPLTLLPPSPTPPLPPTHSPSHVLPVSLPPSHPFFPPPSSVGLREGDDWLLLVTCL